MVESRKTYTEATGRRKTSTARVRLSPASKLAVTVNDKPFEEYFTISMHRDIAIEPLTKTSAGTKFAITVHVSGGGVAGQASAIKQGIARAVLSMDKNTKSDLRKEKMLTRDSRAKERRKFGLKKARKAPQWSKR